MIIRSQNKTRITDDLKLHIYIHFYESTNECYEIRTSSGGVIGEYSTMEKAIKVLDMICEDYAYCETCKALHEEAGKSPAYVFNMPQDSEV